MSKKKSTKPDESKKAVEDLSASLKEGTLAVDALSAALGVLSGGAIGLALNALKSIAMESEKFNIAMDEAKHVASALAKDITDNFIFDYAVDRFRELTKSVSDWNNTRIEEKEKSKRDTLRNLADATMDYHIWLAKNYKMEGEYVEVLDELNNAQAKFIKEGLQKGADKVQILTAEVNGLEAAYKELLEPGREFSGLKAKIDRKQDEINKIKEEIKAKEEANKATQDMALEEEKAAEKKRKAEEAAKRAYEARMSMLKSFADQIKANCGTEEEIQQRSYEKDIARLKDVLKAKQITQAQYDDAFAKRTKEYDSALENQRKKEEDETKAFFDKHEQREKKTQEQIWRIREAYATTDAERDAITIERIEQKYKEEQKLAEETGIAITEIEKAKAAEIKAIENKTTDDKKAKAKEMNEFMLQLREAYTLDEEGRLEIQRERINARYDEQLEKAKENAELTIEIEKARAAEIARIEEQLAQARINSISQYTNSIAQTTKDIATLGKASGNTMKGIAISEATINTALAISKALTGAVWPLNLVLAAGAAASGAVQIAKISSQTFAGGGIVNGNSFYGDQVPVMANSGEMILNKEQQKTLLDIAKGKERDNQPQVNVTFAPNIAPSMNSEDVKKMLRENQSLFIKTRIAA